MNLAQHILHLIFPHDDDQRKRMLQAMESNARETELLTAEIKRASFSPDKQRMFVRINGHPKA